MPTILARISLSIAFGCALVIVLDENRHPQRMGIIKAVRLVNALHLSVFYGFVTALPDNWLLVKIG